MTTPQESRKPSIGLALGSGSARGWAHVGVIRALEEAGVRPDIVCGTSMGALVGAAYAAGELDRLEEWAQELGIGEVVGYFDMSLGSGLVKGDRLMEFFRKNIVDRPIEELQIPFGAVATALETGAEVWMRSGSTLQAVRASVAMPGIFTPVRHEGSLLVDGGLANPVPVSLARAMGADIVIAVDLGSDILGRRFRAPEQAEENASPEWVTRLREGLSTLLPGNASNGPPMPSVADILSTCMDIVQVRMARSRLAGDPPEVLVTPRLAQLRILDFHHASEAIAEGRRAVERVAYSLSLIDRPGA